MDTAYGLNSCSYLLSLNGELMHRFFFHLSDNFGKKKSPREETNSSKIERISIYSQVLPILTT